MSNKERLRITELDFDGIKSNLKTFLKNQTEFTDYDFEGSGMNVLLDVLAYNTHYQAMNANLMGNEMFLDTAQLRSSVVSHAKLLGYKVRSSRAPKAIINVEINAVTGVSTATIPKGFSFQSSIDNVPYFFVTNDAVTKSRENNVLRFEGLEVFEGTLITTRYTVDADNIDQRFIIPDTKADISTLKITVQNSSTDSTTQTYTESVDIVQATSTSNIYFVQEVEDGQHEILFGDGVIGKKLSDGNIVVLEYIVTNETLANGASSLTGSSQIAGTTAYSVTTTSAASGGATRETIDSIKFNAPLDYSAQNRAVTVNDYKVFVRQVFPDTAAVSVWGGEDNDPPKYGVVYISIKTIDGNTLTTSQKTTIQNSLKPYNIASIRTEIVDPEIIQIRLTTNFKYNSTITTKTNNDLIALVTTTLTTYSANTLEEFNSQFRFSDLLGQIDDTDSSINSNVTTIQISKKITPTLNTNSSYEVNFGNSIYNPHSGHEAVVSSTGFKISGNDNELFIDDNDGALRTYYFVGTTKTIVDANFGTVDYIAGKVSIPSANITSISNVDGATSTQIRIVAVPSSPDIIPLRNNILEIDLPNSTVTGKVDTATSSSGSSVATTSTAVTTADTSTSYISTGTSSSSGY